MTTHSSLRGRGVKSERVSGRERHDWGNDDGLPEKTALPFIVPECIDLHDDNGYGLLVLERPEGNLFIGKAFTEVLTEFVGKGLLSATQVAFLTQTFHKIFEEGLSRRLAAAINEGRLRSLKWKATGDAGNFHRENNLSRFIIRNARLSTQGLVLRSEELQLFLSMEAQLPAFRTPLQRSNNRSASIAAILAPPSSAPCGGSMAFSSLSRPVNVPLELSKARPSCETDPRQRQEHDVGHGRKTDDNFLEPSSAEPSVQTVATAPQQLAVVKRQRRGSDMR